MVQPGFKGRCSPLPEDKIVEVGECETTKVPLVICYQSFGDRSNPCVLLVSGLSSTLLIWNDTFCQMIAEKGFYVIRYDNRDVGLSTHLAQFPPSKDLKQPYSLYDMARDGMKLLNSLGIEKAHVVGQSMGGMIVQCMAILFPERVLSLNIFYSHSGDPHFGGVTPHEILNAAPKSNAPEDILDFQVQRHRSFRGKYAVADEVLRQEVVRKMKRCDGDEDGSKRQSAAIEGAEDRGSKLQELRCPTLVVHGKQDTLIPFRNGVKLAELIPEAHLVLYDDMGHSIPEQLFDELVNKLVANFRRSA